MELGKARLSDISIPCNPPVSFGDLWRVAKLRWRTILAATFVILGLIALVLLSRPTLYKGTAVVMLDPRQNNVVDVTAVLSNVPTDQTSILNQIEIIQSRNLAATVARKLHLEDDPEFGGGGGGGLRAWIGGILAARMPQLWGKPPKGVASPANAKGEVDEDLVSDLLGRLNVSQVGLSTAIQIDFVSKDPDKAAAIANAVADSYIQDQRAAKYEASVRATQWLVTRLKQLAEQNKRDELAVEAYKVAHRITEVNTGVPGVSNTVLDQQIVTANNQLMQARQDAAQADANLARVRLLVSSGRAGEVTEVVGSALIGQLRQQEATLIQTQAEMATRYGPQHPKMLELAAQRRELDAKIDQEIKRVVATAENDSVVAHSRAGSLQQTLDELEAQSTVQGEARAGLRELEINAQSSRSLYDRFANRNLETQEGEGLLTPDAHVISRAATPHSPDFPKTPLIYWASLPLSLLLAFSFAFARERIQTGFKAPATVEATLGLTVLSTLPDVSNALSRSSRPRRVVNEINKHPLSGYSEGIRGLSLALEHGATNAAAKVVLVTSSVPGEGKSTTALSLARAFAHTGRNVAVVDGDFRKPGLARLAATAKPQYDLVDLLERKCTLDQCIQRDSSNTVSIVPVSKRSRAAPDLAFSQSLSSAIGTLRQVFDLVVIDSAPLLPVNDSKALFGLADAVVLVIRWEKTNRHAVAESVRALDRFGAPVAGCILTRANPRRYSYYAYGATTDSKAFSSYYQT